jgi:hypothetical protein
VDLKDSDGFTKRNVSKEDYLLGQAQKLGKKGGFAKVFLQ